MIADVEFFSTPFSKANRYFPIPSTGFNSYRVHTENRVKMNEDIDKVITIPSFSGWDDCNIARINGEYYWITHSGSNTIKQGSISFVLEYNAVSSIIKPNQNVTAWYDKTPTRRSNIPFVVEPDVLTLSKRSKIPPLPIIWTDISIDAQTGETQHLRKQIWWCQVTFSYYENIAKSVKNESTFARMGCFVAFDPSDENTISRNGMQSKVTVGGVDGDETWGGLYPSLWEIITDIDQITGFPPSSIVDISISSKCPYDYYTNVYPEPLTGLELTGVGLYNKQGTRCYYRHFDYNNNLERRYMFDLDIRDHPDIPKFLPRLARETTVNLSLSSMEQDLGQVSIVDEGGNKISTLPAQLGSVSLVSKCISDYNGLYMSLNVAGTQQHILVSEGKLPWIGDNWQEYLVRSMDADRDALSFALNQAKDQRNIDILNAVSGGVMSGAMASMAGNPAGLVTGIASAGIGIISSEANNRLTQRQLRFEQDYKERTIRDSASSYVNTGYGLNYLYGTINKGMAIELDMPANTTSGEYNNYTNEYGFPFSGLTNVTFSGNGYVKGRTPESLINGKKGELLNLELVEGFKYRVI